LLVTLDAAECDALLDLAEDLASATWTIDLPSQRIVCPQRDSLHFAIDAAVKSALLAGIDEIDFTLAHLDRIEAKEATLRREKPWLARTEGRMGRT
jgi:3-isopropylmalate/(R)-2-methylmalate dehydratase small subunit